MVPDYTEKLAAQIADAAKSKTPIRIRGGGTKDFYGYKLAGEILDTTLCKGIVNYDPTELVITACAGTSLLEIENTLREQGQMLAFDPPYFGKQATLGGCIAAGLSGPRRAHTGAIRDFILGVRILDGIGQDLRFGGQVMKNVAGYDVSRLMAGSMGTLGLLVEISLKVLPLPEAEITLEWEMAEPEAIQKMNQWMGECLPISATYYSDGCLRLRFSSTTEALNSVQKKLGGSLVQHADSFWAQLKEQSLDFFKTDKSIWRFSVKPTTPPLAWTGEQLIEWGGALRWVASDLDVEKMREEAHCVGGHVTLFRAMHKTAEVFHPLSPALLAIHQRLKKTFDPAGILNINRMYSHF